MLLWNGLVTQAGNPNKNHVPKALRNTAPQCGICDVHWTGGILQHFRAFRVAWLRVFLLPGRVHVRPSAMLREREPLGCLTITDSNEKTCQHCEDPYLSAGVILVGEYLPCRSLKHSFRMC